MPWASGGGGVMAHLRSRGSGGGGFARDVRRAGG